MKKLLLSIALAFISYADTTIVIPANGMTKFQIHSAIDLWKANLYSNSNYVTRVSTDDNVVIKGAYLTSGSYVQGWVEGQVEYTVNISIREGRYRVVINGFTHKSTSRIIKYDGNYGNIYSNVGQGSRQLNANKYRFIMKQITTIRALAESEQRSIISSLSSYVKSAPPEEYW